MVPGVPCVERRNWGRNRDIIRLWQNVVCWEESFGKYRALYVYLAYKDADLFPKGSVLELYILESKPGKLMLEAFSWDNNWAYHGTDKKNWQCEVCCYY